MQQYCVFWRCGNHAIPPVPVKLPWKALLAPNSLRTLQSELSICIETGVWTTTQYIKYTSSGHWVHLTPRWLSEICSHTPSISNIFLHIDQMADYSQMTFENVWILIRISLKFVLISPINNKLSSGVMLVWHRKGRALLQEPIMIKFNIRRSAWMG